MKRCRLSYDEWSCILNKKQELRYVDNSFFRGYVSRIEILEVSEPQIWRFNGEDVTVCQKGYKWLTILPGEEYYCITAMLDEQDHILLWYIDMIAGQGVDADSVPWFDDLYLDLVVYPDGEIVEDDRDELEQALCSGDISRQQAELADGTNRMLREGLLKDMEQLRNLTFRCGEWVEPF